MKLPGLILRALLVSSLLTASLAAQEGGSTFFVQLADTQFGAFTGDRDFAQETVNFEFVVGNINRLRPAFVVICGDLVNRVGDPAQIAEYERVLAMIDPSVPVYSVPGNHDVGNEPTPATLEAWRDRFGPDYYSFERGGIYGIVLDSSLIAAPDNAPAAAAAQEAWLGDELGKAQASDAGEIVVFQHHPWFLADPEEPDQYFNVPLPQRRRYLDMLGAAGVHYVFAGHYHRNAYGTDGDLEMITSGPVGRPLGDDPSGMRIVRVLDDGLGHAYYSLGAIPNQVR